MSVSKGDHFSQPQAKSLVPCLVLIDGLDVVAKKRENAQKDMEVRNTYVVLCSYSVFHLLDSSRCE